MASIGDLFFSLRGDDKALQVDVRKAGDKAGTTFGQRMSAGLKKSWSGGEIGKGLVQGLGLAGGLGAATLITGAISKVVDILGDANAAALAEEVSIQKLNSALKANIPNWDGQTAAIEDVLKARMKLGFSDDEQRESLALLVVATKDHKKALDIERVAMDLARLKGVDLKTASEALIKVEGGQFRALKALGIILPKNATATEALRAVEKAAAGQAEDYANTNAGKLLVSQVKVGEAMEKLGAITLPIVTAGTMAAADAVTGLSSVFDILNGKLPKTKTELQDTQQSLVDYLGTLGMLFPVFGVIGDAAEANMEKVADSTEGMRRSSVNDLSATGNAIEGVAIESGDMADDIKKDNKVVAKSWDDLKRDIVSSANDIIDDAYDPIIDLDRLRANTAELAAVRVILASSKSTAAEKRDARDKLHELKKNNAEYLLALAEAGQTGDAAYAKGISELKTAIKNAKGPAKAALQEVLDKIREVERAGKVVPINIKFATIGAGLGGALNNIFRAEGGPQAAGRPYIVGERGPEIHVPSVSGRILSTSQSIAAVSGGGGGDTNVYLTNNGMPLHEPTPAELVSRIRREARVGNIGPSRGGTGWSNV